MRGAKKKLFQAEKSIYLTGKSYTCTCNSKVYITEIILSKKLKYNLYIQNQNDENI